MTQELTETSTRSDVDQLKELFGPPPVLSSEDIEAYHKIAQGVLRCFGPRDFFERMLLEQAVDASWKIVRYTRHQTLAIDRRFRQRLEFQARQLKLAAERREALNKGGTRSTGSKRRNLREGTPA